MLLLSGDDVAAAITIREVIDAVETAQRLRGRGLAVNSPISTLFENVDPAILPEFHGNFQYFAGYLGGDINVEGLASSASCVQNPTRFGLPYAVGLQILNDVATGMPLAVIERSFLTELVTPAFSAIGARHLARKEAQTIGIIGCGKQGRTHLRAFAELLNIKRVVAFDVRKEAMDAYVREMTEQSGLHIEPAASAEDAVKASDIAEVAINPTRPVVKYDWIKPGGLLIALSGFGDELDKDDVYRRIDRVVFDCPENLALSQGAMPVNDAQELSKIVAGVETCRQSDEEKIVFVHSGMAINHVSAGHLVYRKAKAMNLGVEFDVFHGVPRTP